MPSKQKPNTPTISPASNTSHSNAGRPARNATHNVAGGPLKAALLGITLVLAAFIIPKAISPHWPPSLFLSDAGFNDIVIHARGTNGQEKVALYINDAPVQFWNLTTSFQDYTYTPPTAITVNNLSIHFLNDRWEPESGINYDVQVDYITVNGTRYDSEHNSTISTGSWDQNDWCAPGNKSQEWLHCSGSFTYNIPAGTVVGIGAPITLTPPTLTGTLDSQSQITLTWNTVPEATSYRINRGGTFYQEITGTTLIETGLTPDTEYVYSVRAKKDENISSGSNVVRLKTVGTSSGLNVVSHEAIDITETTAKLRFTASENVQAYTDYGTDINYGLQTNQETSFDYATHVQTLSDLTPGTQYFYKIVVINQASEQVTDTGTFTTTGGVSAPVCGNNQVEAGEQCDDGNTVGGDGCSSTCNTETSSNLTIDAHVATDITQTSVRLRFTASENVQAYTEYGTTTSYGSQTATETSFNYATHAQSITGLTEDTTYYYRINVTNQVGENSTATGSFTTDEEDVTPPPTPISNRDQFWSGRGYSLVWSDTPTSGDLSNSVEDYFRSSGWSNGYALNRFDIQEANSVSMTTGPGGDPVLRAKILKGNQRSFAVRGTQLGPKGNEKRKTIFAGDWYMECNGSSQYAEGAYIGIGHHWGTREGKTSIPAGGVNRGDAWSIRVPISGSGNYSVYTYFYDNEGYGDSTVAQNTPPRCDQWNTVELEVINNSPVSASNGTLILHVNGVEVHRRSNVRLKVFEDLNAKGYGMFLYNSAARGPAKYDLTHYYKNWKIYTGN